MRGKPYHIERQHDAGQRERDDRERDRWNGNGIGKRRDERELLEQRERGRYEADRHDPLRACAFTQCSFDSRPLRQRRRRRQTPAASE